MRQSTFAAIAALATSAYAATNSTSSLTDVCTVANVQAALPANNTILDIEMIPSSVTAVPAYNISDKVPGGITNAPVTYCNVTVSFTHTGKGDAILLNYAFPSPAAFANRYYVAGGEAFSLSTDATGGIQYGAVGGATDAGYDALDGIAYDEVVLYGNGSINWYATYAFGYVALGEMASIGKVMTPFFYGLSSDTKIYTYFEGCSDGGREGMSQIQRWGDLYDGAITDAPAMRFAQQQVTHMLGSVVEQTLDYYPPPCEIDQIINATIAACDPLDGITNGIISRTDLCKLNFNLTSIIGQSYYCAATTSTSLGVGFAKRQANSETTTTPDQNGTVTAEGVAVAQAIYDGLHNSAGERAYLSFQIGSELSDSVTAYDNDTNSYILDIPSTGGEYVARWIKLFNIDNLDNIDNVTYDTVVEWMNTGMVRYLDSLQNTLPDLTPFQSHAGKLLHYHDEFDPSVPSASFIHDWNSVRSIMYHGCRIS